MKQIAIHSIFLHAIKSKIIMIVVARVVHNSILLLTLQHNNTIGEIINKMSSLEVASSNSSNIRRI